MHKGVEKGKNEIKEEKGRKYTQNKKTLIDTYKTIGDETRKATSARQNITNRADIDEELYKKLKKQTLTYKTSLKQGKNIALILSTCPEILKEALSISDLRAYKLYLNNTFSKDTRKGFKSKSRDKNELREIEVEDIMTNEFSPEDKSNTPEEDGN